MGRVYVFLYGCNAQGAVGTGDVEHAYGWGNSNCTSASLRIGAMQAWSSFISFSLHGSQFTALLS